MIAVYQADDEYPSFHAMVTDNPRYAAGKAVMEKEKAVEAFKKWLEKNTNSERT